jgi:hypothetical protein
MYYLRISLFTLITFAATFQVLAEIPDWYKNGIAKIVSDASRVTVYRTESINLEKESGAYKIYRINTATLQSLKGAVEEKACYFIQREDGWPGAEQKIGEVRIAIIEKHNDKGCSVIEPGRGAPGTKEYIDLLKSLVNKNA